MPESTMSPNPPRQTWSLLSLGRCSIVALLVLVLSSCGAGGARPSGDPDPSATLRVGSQIGVTSWDPARSPGGPEIQLFSMVYDRLIHMDASGELEPGAAESWSFEDDHVTLLLKLRAGLKFSDGTPITPEVVKQNLDRAMTLPESSLSSVMANIKSVEVSGDTVRIRQKEPDVAMPALLSERPGMIVNPSTFDALNADDVPIGSGQFTVTNQEPGVSISFRRNATYWDAEVIKVGGVDLTVISDSTARFNAVRTGQVDLTRVDPDQTEDAETASELTLTTGPVLEVGVIFFNPNIQPALGKPEVRKAISLAVDRQAIVDGILFGQGTATAQFYPRGHRAHVDELDRHITPDLDRARDLLAQAGYADGFAFEAVVYSPKMDRVAQAVQAQLAKVGITMDLKPLPGYGAPTEFTGNKAAAEVISYPSRGEPSLTYRANFLAGQFFNPGNISSPEVAKLIEAGMAESDPGKQTEIERQIATLLIDDPLANMPLYTVNQILLSRDNVIGLKETWIDGFPHLDGLALSR